MTDRSADYLVKLLAESLGPRAARERVEGVVRAQRLDAGKLSQDDALRVLEQLAQEKGLVGTVARFAKVRLTLSWDAA